MFCTSLCIVVLLLKEEESLYSAWLNTVIVCSVGRCGTHPWLLQVSQGGGDAMAPFGGKALSDTAGWELQSRHFGGRRWVPSEPVSLQLEGTVPVFVYLCRHKQIHVLFCFYIHWLLNVISWETKHLFNWTKKDLTAHLLCVSQGWGQIYTWNHTC